MSTPHPNGAMHERGERQMAERAFWLEIYRQCVQELYVYGEVKSTPAAP